MTTMNYRQISTKIWKDDKFVSLDDSCQKLVLYLITNSQIGLIPVYKIQEREVLFDLCWNKDKYQKCLEKIKSVGIYLIDEYILLDNQFANYFITGGKTEEERNRQINSLPENIKLWVNNDISIAQLLSNHSPMIETITPIPNPISKSNKYIKIEDLKEEDFENIAEKYQVPISFVRSKLDDMINWHEKNPQKNYYKNYLSALRDWVKRDMLKIKQDYGKQSSEVSI